MAEPNLNNLQHGFRSSLVLLPGEDPAEYNELHAQLTEHFDPADLTETRHVREMADAEYRLRRCRHLMQTALRRQIATVAADHPGLTDPLELESKAIETLAATGCSWSTWLRYETKFERQYDRAYREWNAYQETQRRAERHRSTTAFQRTFFAPLSGDVAEDVPEEDIPEENIPEAVSEAAPQPVSNVQSEPAQPLASTPAPAPIPRNAPCPCRSGEKYKRCCGKEAPPVLGPALNQAA